MIDIHCHILPGLDDGAETIVEAVQIAHELLAAGFDTVIATPHVMEGREYITPVQIREKVHKLNQVFQQKEIPLQVLPGAENYIFPELPSWYRDGKLLTLADTHKYILIELPMTTIPTYTEQVFFELQVLGLTPILAHPERNREITQDPTRLLSWAQKGIQLQVNLRSFNGTYGSKAQELAENLLASGMIHFIGSDLHKKSAHHTHLKTILERITTFDSSKLVAASSENPTHIVSGEYFTTASPSTFTKTKNKPVKVRGWLQALLARM